MNARISSKLTERPVVTSRVLLEEISSKWTILVLSALCARPLRFNELMRQIDGVTQKALTQRLRSLERLGIISRTISTVSPISVKYAITQLGRSMGDPLSTLLAWTETNSARVEQAAREFEQRHC